MEVNSEKGHSVRNRLKLAINFFIITFLFLIPLNGSSATTNSYADKFLEALKSAQPVKIEAARNKFVTPNSSADLFALLVINHFKTTEYMKTLDKYGNVSPTAHDLPGKLKKSKSGVFTLDSTFNTIDGSYKNFKYSKSGRISSFDFKLSNSSFKSIRGNIQNLTINYFNAGTEINSGIHWKLPNDTSFVQVNYVNKFGGLKSWSFARGYIRDASGVNHDVVTGPIGCTTTGGTAVIEGTTSSDAAIVKGTTSVFVIPFYLDCQGLNSSPINVPFTVQ